MGVWYRKRNGQSQELQKGGWVQNTQESSRLKRGGGVHCRGLRRGKMVVWYRKRSGQR